jgi:hypothetical protein
MQRGWLVLRPKPGRDGFAIPMGGRAMIAAARERLIARVAQNVKRFSWTEMARRTQEVWRECAQMRVCSGRHTS